MTDFTRKNSPQDDLLKIVSERIGDYNSRDLEKQRAELVALWQSAHPECINQPPSLKHHPLIKTHDGVVDNFNKPEYWNNDIYQVTVRRWSRDRVFDSNGGMIQIGINTLDGTARHDWREMQYIKNQIAGETCEAFELYPSEDRLLDPSNYYTLWCFPGLKRIRVGVEKRNVYDANEAFAPQRGFEK